MEILSLGEKIKRRRKELGMTLKDLAGDRITPGQISLVESGRSNPSMDLLEYLATTLKTSVEYLMESEETQAEKICIYYEQIAEANILNNDILTGEKYIEQALYYAEKYNLDFRKAKNLYLRAEIYMKQDENILAQQFFLSANVIFIKNNNQEEIVKTFLNLGKITFIMKAYHSANTYLKQAEKLYLDNNLGEDFILGEIYYYLSKTYFHVEDLRNAMNYSFLAKEKFAKIYNREEYAKTLMLLAEQYNKEGDLENAIKYSKKTLSIYKELNDSRNISNIENSLGKLFYEFENLEESFIHFDKAKKIREENNDKGLIETLLNICENYIKLKDIASCTKTLEQINQLLKLDDIEEFIQYNIVKFRLNMIKENLKEAEIVLIDTYNFAKNNDLDKQRAEIAIMIGKFYLDNKREFEAATYLDEGVKLFRKVGIIKN
ncbi:Helix-turn-helix domain-containing protein [Clostridium cavendishii DSM 21758]|uniref:Helix-turn-helix domain-containing protein n=1 Tax=Clostridium cavendishii DSM 21758 TaxID=1121302 RepID=A0A1M6CKL1_9CLOT|nr:helix-turn-helix transcriptional regulator [Clostridium cavendishii]SHI61509.1 Helix-turn-helix domain-containing protein [Clostridium cavendishii DSM 21758]